MIGIESFRRRRTQIEVGVVSLLLVDRSQFMVDTMTEVLKRQPGLTLVGTTTDAKQALLHVEECNTLVISADLPDRTALDLVKRARQIDPRVKIVVMDLLESEDVSSEYLRAGAWACVFEGETIDRLLQKVRG